MLKKIENKKGSAKSRAFSWFADASSAKAKLSWPFFPRGKKGIEMTMQLIVVVIIMLALLVFLLIFLTGQGGKVTALWENITIGAVQSAGP